MNFNSNTSWRWQMSSSLYIFWKGCSLVAFYRLAAFDVKRYHTSDVNVAHIGLHGAFLLHFHKWFLSEKNRRMWLINYGKRENKSTNFSSLYVSFRIHCRYRRAYTISSRRCLRVRVRYVFALIYTNQRYLRVVSSILLSWVMCGRFQVQREIFPGLWYSRTSVMCCDCSRFFEICMRFSTLRWRLFLFLQFEKIIEMRVFFKCIYLLMRGMELRKFFVFILLSQVE